MPPYVRRYACVDSWANCWSSRQGNQIEIWMKYLPTIIEVQGWLETAAPELFARAGAEHHAFIA